jgi:hypothetical protein
MEEEDMTMSEEDIKDLFRAKARDGRITCAECLAIARDIDLPASRIADLLNGMDIRIVSCQLGCFP